MKLTPATLFEATSETAIPIRCIRHGRQDNPAALGSKSANAYARSVGFAAKPGELVLTPGPDGAVDGVLLGIGDGGDPFISGVLPTKLPNGTYEIVDLGGLDPTITALALGFASYRYDRFRTEEWAGTTPKFIWPGKCDQEDAQRIIEAVFLARDLINTPAAQMGPQDLATASRALAQRCGAQIIVIEGDDLIDKNFPLIHAVGRASPRPPCLIDVTWGDPSAPKVTLVGKGVCFDTGGLNLKASDNMRLMKKDMGGSANVLALALMIMTRQLNVNLRVLIPAVENSIAGGALRPGDVLTSRKGLTVEIGNTDAEGRLVLADALALADEDEPDILIDMATLTGAARTALGPDLPSFFCNDDEFAAAVLRAGADVADPMWRMPLWPNYAETTHSHIADFDNSPPPDSPGSLVAALILQKFVQAAKTWAHIDFYAWNARVRPARPIGGEAYAIRAIYAALKSRYG